MKAGGALVLTADAGEAARRAVGEARASLGDAPASFGVLFASAHFSGSAEALAGAVAEETGRLPLIGCVAEAVAGGAREIESGPAGSAPADLRPVHVPGQRTARPPEPAGARGGAHGWDSKRRAGAAAEPVVSRRAGALVRRRRRPPAVRHDPSPGGAGVPSRR